MEGAKPPQKQKKVQVGLNGKQTEQLAPVLLHALLISRRCARSKALLPPGQPFDITLNSKGSGTPVEIIISPPHSDYE